MAAEVINEDGLHRDARHALLSLGYGEHAGKATPIFVGQRGPLTPRGFQILLAPYVRAAGLKDVEGKIPDVAAVKLMLNTGLRVAEFCAVNWKDVRLSDRQGTLTVRKGKGSKRRQIRPNL